MDSLKTKAKNSISCIFKSDGLAKCPVLNVIQLMSYMNNGAQTLRRNYGCFQQGAHSTATSTPTMIIDPAVQELMAGLPSTNTTVAVSEPPQTPGSSQQTTTQAAVAGGHLMVPPPSVQVGYA